LGIFCVFGVRKIDKIDNDLLIIYNKKKKKNCDLITNYIYNKKKKKKKKKKNHIGPWQDVCQRPGPIGHHHPPMRCRKDTRGGHGGQVRRILFLFTINLLCKKKKKKQTMPKMPFFTPKHLQIP
jgi:hypothetical protein